MVWGGNRNLVHVLSGRKIAEKVLFESFFLLRLESQLILILLNYRLPVFFRGLFFTHFKRTKTKFLFFISKWTQTHSLMEKKKIFKTSPVGIFFSSLFFCRSQHEFKSLLRYNFWCCYRFWSEVDGTFEKVRQSLENLF
jgi:hypothetical protein